MYKKCSHCDVALRTVTSVIFWLDVIICGCIFYVQISDAQDESCLQGREDCSIKYHTAACLAINIFLGLVALYGVRKNKPNFLLPYVACKILLISSIITLSLYWKYFTSSEIEIKWLLPVDQCNAFALCIIFGFQLYIIFIAIWNFKMTRKAVSACRTQKSFKSVVSIWIGGPSNMTTAASESTCIIETGE